ncbi:hypothetical protein CKY10_15100 [Photorhabdus sp. HUG-39]|uniref:Type 4b pilus protein PilO2 n=1 Tax=Photorhabdus kayaii TaxID=230088 RepID=A0ABX0B7T2_9GAMM|nr:MULTISPECIES: type 4b pilus protein PilO2 [Photorhabdus]MCC8372898.1 type 4b pilus protein PilO2 [Photorhabdus bodei]NDL13074.1 type 4b pilus protein PilO2 [Photorhabdus kayaii]NDL26802.1 type 4b pilus protein PilO2 [Photorhabdus kayaii]RAX08436.1 hypothetical protein CKY10_15100 [Photorhabdus sp. HUG-39]
MTEIGVEHVMQIKLCGKTLVAGIIWRPPVAVLARANMRRNGIAAGFTLAVRHRVGRGVQVGYAPKEAGEPGYYSLAAVLAKVVDKSNWIGAFRLSDACYALVAVHQGAIMAGRDLIGTREEIETKLRETVQLVEDANGVWHAIYAPKEFESLWPEMPLEQLLSKSILKKSVGQLESLTGEMSKYQIKVFVMTAGLTLLLGGGWWMWHTYKQNRVVELPDLPREVVEALPPHPWLAQPQMAWQFSTWKRVLARVPLSLAGWQVESISLDTDTVSVSYQRHEGMPINIFQVAAINIFRAGPVISNGGEQAQVLIPIEQQSEDQAGNDDVLQSSDQALVELISYFQALNLPPPVLTESASVLPPPPPPRAEGDTQVWANPDWQTYSWTLSSQLPPDALFSGKPFPGLRVTSAKVVLADGFPQWELNGVFYAKN